MRNFLHVGCGHKRKEQTTWGFNKDDWAEVRLDINPDVLPDLIGTMTDMSVVPDASMAAIFSSHNIEHLYPHEIHLALTEFLRVLDSSGFAIITCPDLQSVCALIANDQLSEPAYISSAGPIAPLDILYGHGVKMAKGNLYMAHHTGFTRKTLHSTLQGAGFLSVATRARPEDFDLWAVASKSPRKESDMRKLIAEHYPS